MEPRRNQMEITGYNKRCFFKAWLFVLLIAIGSFILSQNSVAEPVTSDEVMKLKCKLNGTFPFEVDFGVDPSPKDMMILAPVIATCDINTVNKEMIGCLEMQDGIDTQVPPGTYNLFHEKDMVAKINYQILANFKPNRQVYVLPRVNDDWSLPNSGLVFPSEGGSIIQLNWYTNIKAPDGDPGLRYVKAGKYRGPVIIHMRINASYIPETRCEIGLPGTKFWEFYVYANVTITKKCTIQKVDPLNFGEHTELKKDIFAYSNINIGCNSDVDGANVPFTLKFNNGQNATTNGQRRMRSGSNYIDYDIFYQENHQPVGDVPGLQYSGSGSQTIKVFGKVQKREGKIPGGTYTDIVLLTLEY